MYLFDEERASVNMLQMNAENSQSHMMNRGISWSTPYCLAQMDKNDRKIF